MNKCINMSENAEKGLIKIANDPEKLKQFVKYNDLMLKLNFRNGFVKGTIVALEIVGIAFEGYSIYRLIKNKKTNKED